MFPLRKNILFDVERVQKVVFDEIWFRLASVVTFLYVAQGRRFAAVFPLGLWLRRSVQDRLYDVRNLQRTVTNVHAAL